MICISVVLPEPDAPVTDRYSPRATCRSTDRRAVTRPLSYILQTF